MRTVRIVIICAASVLTAQVCAAQQEPATQPAQVATPAAQQNQVAAVPASASAAAIPSYPDTPKGLEDLMGEMLKLEKKHDAKGLAPYVESLELPNASTWFRATFGDEVGVRLADSSERTRVNLQLVFPELLEQLNAKHFTHPKAELLTDSCNGDASAEEFRVLASRRDKQLLYHVRFTSSSQTATVSYFAYVDGAFRYLTYFRINPQINSSAAETDGFKVPGAVNVGGNVIRGRLTREVTPMYPVRARMEGIQGSVLLRAIIGENGNVCNLRVVSGDPLLAASAMAAVRQWQYKPYMINGQPVNVDTTITVTFHLGN